MKLSGWGRYPVCESDVQTPRSADDVVAQVKSGRVLIARGNGRAYGDAAVGPSATVCMLALNNVISFDEETGFLVCEAGALLCDLLDAFVPRGWFAPVTPGTKFVTIGGMVACDVHGKNHHKDGSFGNHVQWLDVVGADGSIVRCSRRENADLFASTVGGMGLTGIIVRCCVQLIRIETAFVRQRRVIAANLSEILEAFETSTGWTYSVAWIDCLAKGSRLGRSVLYLGEHAQIAELPEHRQTAPLRRPWKLSVSVPFELPMSVLSYLTVKAFNALYFEKAERSPAERLVDYDSYFYPLDSIQHWNRLYGWRGFVQYQCALPFATSREGLRELLELISESKSGSFLAVLKLFGTQEGILSFPLYGYTLALDFPWSAKTAELLERLDDVVLRHGGRIYLAKDARLPRTSFERMQPNLDLFKRLLAQSGADKVFRSKQSQRLGF